LAGPTFVARNSIIDTRRVKAINIATRSNMYWRIVISDRFFDGFADILCKEVA